MSESLKGGNKLEPVSAKGGGLKVVICVFHPSNHQLFDNKTLFYILKLVVTL